MSAPIRNKKKKIEQAAQIVARLIERYPSAECALEYHGEPWRLLVMGRLSAQCTDARVNIVCEELFARFPTLTDLADAPLADIEGIVRPCGLYRTKAANIKDACIMLRDEFGGVLPADMDTLLTFPGVGRKIANLLLGDIYHLPAIVADTHCIRICGRLGFYPESLKDPHKVEEIMVQLVEPTEQSDFCHRIVWFGREVCTARSPKCHECPLSDLCAKGIKEYEKQEASTK
jgi:endonuclease-3